MPMSHTTISPAASEPGGHTSPVFAAWKVTVMSAATQPAAMVPVEASTPDGTSTAITGTPSPPMTLIFAAHSATRPLNSPVAPVPSRQSSTSSASSHR